MDHFVGVRGPTVFGRLSRPALYIPKSFPSDFLHLICEGVMKKIAAYWLKNLQIDVQQINRRITALQPNYQVKRQPRNIDDLNKMSATELLFLVFFGIPIFNGLIPPQYLKHFSVLVRACSILLSDELSLGA